MQLVEYAQVVGMVAIMEIFALRTALSKPDPKKFKYLDNELFPKEPQPQARLSDQLISQIG